MTTSKSAPPRASDDKPKKSRSRRDRRRAHRRRPTPRWLLSRQDLDEVARRRCLMVLSVLSGEKPVTDVIAEAKISRGTYYQLEERAIGAMLRALSPAAGPDGTESLAVEVVLAQVKELQRKVTRLEQDKRRAERLLYLARKVVKPGPLVVEGRGRPRGRRSTSSGTSASPSSTASPSPSSSPTVPTSTPTPAGGDGRPDGSENWRAARG